MLFYHHEFLCISCVSTEVCTQYWYKKLTHRIKSYMLSGLEAPFTKQVSCFVKVTDGTTARYSIQNNKTRNLEQNTRVAKFDCEMMKYI